MGDGQNPDDRIRLQSLTFSKEESRFGRLPMMKRATRPKAMRGFTSASGILLNGTAEMRTDVLEMMTSAAGAVGRA